MGIYNTDDTQGLLPGFTTEDWSLRGSDMPRTLETPKADLGCDHVWKFYTGLREQYEYCERCEAKRGN
jgi:hypothetical protein